MGQIAPELERASERGLRRLSAGLALAGGAVLAAMAVITSLSVAGRALSGLGLGPVRGDFELVEMGCAVAVFAFLPWCQVTRAHVRVDIFAARLPDRAQAGLGLLGEVALAVCAGVIAWRLWLGTGERIPYGGERLRAALAMGPKPFFPETTYDLQVPVWIPFTLAFIGAALFFLTCLHGVWRALNRSLAGPRPSRA